MYGFPGAPGQRDAYPDHLLPIPTDRPTVAALPELTRDERAAVVCKTVGDPAPSRPGSRVTVFERDAPGMNRTCAHGGFSRALAQRNPRSAEIAANEMGGLSLIDALEYLVVLAELQPDRARLAAIR